MLKCFVKKPSEIHQITAQTSLLENFSAKNWARVDRTALFVTWFQPIPTLFWGDYFFCTISSCRGTTFVLQTSWKNIIKHLKFKLEISASSALEPLLLQPVASFSVFQSVFLEFLHISSSAQSSEVISNPFSLRF